MKIAVVGSTSPDDFADNIVSALAQMGHEPVALGPVGPTGAGNRARAVSARAARLIPGLDLYWQSRIVSAAKSARPDLVVTVDARLAPDTVRSLRDVAPTVLWYPDSVANLGAQVMLSAPYDIVFFKDPILVDRLRSVAGLRAEYLPEACNPAWHLPSPRPTVDPVLVVAGNLYPSRALLLERLHRADIPLRLHAWRWARSIRGLSVQRLPLHAPIRRAEKARVFRSSAAVLNNLHPAEQGANCRLFEATGCGAVAITEDRAALDDLFEREREVLTFSDFDELVDRVRWVLANPERGTEIGDAAARRAQAEHTYQHRLDTLIVSTAAGRPAGAPGGRG